MPLTELDIEATPQEEINEMVARILQLSNGGHDLPPINDNQRKLEEEPEYFRIKKGLMFYVAWGLVGAAFASTVLISVALLQSNAKAKESESLDMKPLIPLRSAFQNRSQLDLLGAGISFNYPRVKPSVLEACIVYPGGG